MLMGKTKVTLVDLTLVGTTFAPVGYGETRFETIKAAKAWLKDKGYKVDLALTKALNDQGSLLDVYTKRRAWDSLEKAYLEKI